MSVSKVISISQSPYDVKEKEAHEINRGETFYALLKSSHPPKAILRALSTREAHPIQNAPDSDYDYFAFDMHNTLQSALQDQNVTVIPPVENSEEGLMRLSRALRYERTGSPRTLIFPFYNKGYWTGFLLKLNGKNQLDEIQHLSSNGILSRATSFNGVKTIISSIFGKREIKEGGLFLNPSRTASGPLTVENLVWGALGREIKGRNVDDKDLLRIRAFHISLVQKAVSTLRVRTLFFQLTPEPVRFLKMMSHKQGAPHLVLLGKSGAGKGTLAKILNDNFGHVHLSIGDIHRGENTRGTALGLKIRDLVKQQKFICPEMDPINRALLDPLFADIFSKRKKVCLDNFPTAPCYVPHLLDVIARHRLQRRIVMLVPNISDNESYGRLTSRRVCSLNTCGRSYNVVSIPPKVDGKCDHCNSALVTRVDDNPGMFKIKGMIYDKHIEPAIRTLAQRVDLFFFRDIFSLFTKHLGIKLDGNYT